MSSTTADPAAPSSGNSSQADEKAIRARARRRASCCPGTGWALLGYPGRGNLVLFCVAAWLAALAWLVLTLSSASIWSAGISTLVALAVWSAELLDTGWCVVRSPAEGLLARRFGFATIMVWGACLILMVFAFLSFRLMVFHYESMVPAVEPGELLIFHRRVADADLKPGTVIAFNLPPHARVEEWSGPGPVIARILAGPDDELTIRDGRYVVNGEVTGYRPTWPDPKAPLPVPAYPRKLTVPATRYFVVQDSPGTGVDSQQLDYVRRMDVLSARLFHFGRRGLMRPLE